MAKYVNLIKTNILSEERFTPISFKILFIIVCFFSVVYQIYFIPLIIIALLSFLVLDSKYKELLLIFAALFPFSLGKVVNIENLTFAEILTPVMFLALLFDCSKKPLKINRVSKKFVFAISILILWSIFHYTKNPVSAAALFGLQLESGGLRAYYSIFVCTIIYFICFRYFSYERFNPDIFLKLILITSLLLGLLRTISYFFSFKLPLGGAFDYGLAEGGFGEELVHRIGGIDRSIHIGLSSLFGYYYRKKHNILFIILLLLFYALAVVGGGRTIFVGMIICTIGYFIFIVKSRLFYFMIPFLAILFLFLSYFHPITRPNQFNRLFAFDAILKLQYSNIYRGQVWSMYFRTFLRNPIFGKGVGFVEEDLPNAPDNILYKFAKSNIALGGHNGYLSVLAIFGIGGAIFLGIMLFGTIYFSFHYFRVYAFNKFSNIVLFILFLSILSAIYYLTSMSGYKETLLYLSAGTIAGIYSRKK